MNKTSHRIAAATILALTCPPLLAHPGHGAALMDGFLHPAAGLDHLLGAFATGLWAARQGGMAGRALVLSFLILLVCGIVLGAAGFAPGWLEQGIAVSLVAAGLPMAFALRLPSVPAVAIASLGALMHGLAHGAEIPAAASAFTFGAGMAAGTALILLAGIKAGTRLTSSVHLFRLAGAGTAATGIALIMQAIQ